ncbi:MAG: substrate-binding domain-containing protein [Reyranellaceae bacterium]
MADLAADAVVIDNSRALCDIVRCLIGEGHRRVGLITGRQSLSTGQERYRGYRDALAEAKLPYEPQLVVSTNFGEEGGYCAAGRLLSLDQPPTAIFARNNLRGLRLLRALHERGLACPDDIAMACFDDFDCAEVSQPRLTTVAQPTRAIGRQVILLLLECLRDPLVRGLPPRLVRLGML